MNVLCTSAGNDGFPAVLAGLRERSGLRVVAADADAAAVGLHLADGHVVLPTRADPAALIASLHAAIATFQVDVILPLSTDDQTFFAAHYEGLVRSGTAVAASPLSAVRVANDKHALYRHAQSLGVPLPSFTMTSERSEVVALLSAYQARGARCVLKKSHGTGAQGVKVVDPETTTAGRFWQRDHVVISSEEALAWARTAHELPPLLICDYLPGDHLSVDAFHGPDGAFHAVVRTETRHLYGMGTAGRTVDEPGVVALARTLAESLGLRYAFNVEFRQDRDGQPRLLEINPRFAASVGHSIAAGVNFPLLVVDAALGVPSGSKVPTLDVEFRRFWTQTTWAGVRT